MTRRLFQIAAVCDGGVNEHTFLGKLLLLTSNSSFVKMIYREFDTLLA